VIRMTDIYSMNRFKNHQFLKIALILCGLTFIILIGFWLRDEYNETVLHSKAMQTQFDKAIKVFENYSNLCLHIEEVDSSLAFQFQDRAIFWEFKNFEYGDCFECGSLLFEKPTSLKPVLLVLDNHNVYFYSPIFFHEVLPEFWLSLTIAFLLTTVLFSSLVFFFKTIQHQKILQELKNDFFQNITHELKTPVAAIQITTEALQNYHSADKSKTQEYLGLIAQNSQQLNSLIEKILQLSILERKDFKSELHPVDLEQLFNQAIIQVQPLFKDDQIVINKKIENKSAFIQGNAEQLINCFTILLENAFKYSKENLCLNITCSYSDTWARLSIQDNGIGIPKAYHPFIFKKYFRVPSGQQHDIKGFGLGLYYVSEIMEHHGGKINITSEPNISTCFTLSFPIQPIDK